ncbi:hypothetical protein ABPG75_000389 [Micractinium tetrahymenae]
MGPPCTSTLAGARTSSLSRWCSRSAALCTLLLALLAASGAQPEPEAGVPALTPALSAPPLVVLPLLSEAGSAKALLAPAAEQAPVVPLPDLLPAQLSTAAALPAAEPIQPAAEATNPFATTDPFAGTAPPAAGAPDPFAETDSVSPLPAAEAAALPATEALPLEATALPTTPGLPEDAATVLGSGGAAAGGGGAVTGGGDGVEQLPDLLPPATPPAALSPDTLPDPSKRTGRLISLLNPPPGYDGPPLTQKQQEMVPKLRQLRVGKATVGVRRDVGMLDGGTMACGIAYLNDHFQKHWVGLPVSLFHEAELCGACVRMWCVDSVCDDALVKSDLFMITDSCKECGPTDLLASGPGLTNLSGGVSVDLTPKFQVAWTFASCAPLIQGGIKMWPSDRNKKEYLGLQFSNLKALLKAVAVNGIMMQRTNFGYWVIDTPGKPIPLRPPFQIDLLSVKNERVTAKVPTLRAQDLGVNFKN